MNARDDTNGAEMQTAIDEALDTMPVDLVRRLVWIVALMAFVAGASLGFGIGRFG